MEACRLRRVWVVRILVAAALAILSAPRPGLAQSYEVVHTFESVGGGPAGSVALTAKGVLVGVTTSGGLIGSGSVFRLNPDGQGGYVFEELHAFLEDDGQFPKGGVVADGRGFFYGTTEFGGEHHIGAIFRIDAAGRHTVIHSLDRSVDGGLPTAPLIVTSDGSIWGTCQVGGMFDAGTVFRLDPAGGFTTIHSFDNTDGAIPRGRLLQGSDGNIYGTTSNRGSLSGTVFRVDSQGNFALLHDFVDPDEGFLIAGGLAEGDDGKLYGVASDGGTGGGGVIYRLDKSGANFEVVHNFATTDGSNPESTMTRASIGGFYGTTLSGGAHGGGTAFHLDDTGTVTTLHDFAFETGAPSVLDLLEGPGGDLYGGTSGGGAFGTIFRLETDGTYTVLTGFDQRTPQTPQGGLIDGGDGSLYGATDYAPPIPGASVYSFTLASSQFSVLRFLTADEGIAIQGSLLKAFEGAFYGMALDGGVNDQGTLFRIAPGGDFTLLHQFDAETGDPTGGFSEGGDGFLYGARGFGSGMGEIFKMDSDGVVSTVHAFTGPDGAFPASPPIRASNGNLYGTTQGGGSGPVPWGTLYRIDSVGTFASIHDFGKTDGYAPGDLLQGSDGNLYGTAVGGGKALNGVVFKVDASETVTSLHEFHALTDGQGPNTLSEWNGELYGTTTGGGSGGQGTVFRLGHDGTYEVLHHFHGQEGSVPFGRPLVAADGGLYGTTANGGIANRGVVYRIYSGGLVPMATGPLSPASGRAGGGTSVTFHGDAIAPDATVTIGGAPLGDDVPAIGVADIDCFTLRFIMPPLPPTSQPTITISNPGGGTLTLNGFWFADFLDVDSVHPFYDYVDALGRARITAGCGNGNYCPDDSVTREQMAVFLLKSEHGSSFTPPPCAGVFTDVPCTPGVGFPDWIEQLYAEHVTGGCILSPLQYCPGRTVTRAEMAVLLLKTQHGTDYTPNPCAGIFADVPCPATPEFPYSDWIEQLYADAITSGCAVGPPRYCPDNPNTRGEMAVFLTRTFLQ
jgi:uncharacterized repeat protein (TIGR03803 family)